MNTTLRDHIRLRSVALWCVTTTAAVGIGMLAVPPLAESRRGTGSVSAFTDLLVTGCAAAALVATGWLWALTTDVVVRVLMTGGRIAVRRPGPVRLLLVAACGAVALTAAAAPATADERRPDLPQSLAGLPLPDRATGDGHASGRGNTDRPDRPGRPTALAALAPASRSGSNPATPCGRSPSSNSARTPQPSTSPVTGPGSTAATPR